MAGSNSQTNKKRFGWKLTLLVCIFILLLGVGITALIFFTEPTATRIGATRETAMLVQVTRPEHGTFRPVIRSTGTVQPAQDIILSPRVSGEIIDRSPNFTPGGFVSRGEILVQLDQADYQNRLMQRQSELRRAETDLQLEMGRQDVARQDYKLLEKELSKEKEALVLRRPQLNAARAVVESARAAVAQARLELQRTNVSAPFNAQVLSRNVNIGSQVAAGDSLGRLVGIDIYWIETLVPVGKLRRLIFPDASGSGGSRAEVRDRSAWPQHEYRTGKLFKLIGSLEDRTRMARVLIEVEDPLARRPESSGLQPLIIGAFVETALQGRKIADVVRLHRDYIRKNDTAWVMKEEKLAIRDLEIVFRDADYAYISKGLTREDLVVTTNLATVAEGVRLRLKNSDNAGGQHQPASKDQQEDGGRE